MRIALIANNPAIEVIPTAEYYLHFNRALHWGKTPQYKSSIVVRLAHTVHDAKSWRPYPNTQDADVMRCGWRVELNEHTYGVYEHKTSIYVDDVLGYPPGKSPTSGWAAIHSVLPFWKEVITVGFDLKVASYYGTTKLHAVDYEIEELNKLWELGKVTKHDGRSTE